MGRPGEMSPKARFWMLAGWLLLSRFNTEPPFDRHDWIVWHPRDGTEIRYRVAVCMVDIWEELREKGRRGSEHGGKP
ncbi:hypothetical protein DEU56DRAFT_812170 [Suillus clintonianus]|uniref:uncharacterized protein n=1 Tax=Suillus clintonianus TaxID=1904413 RepID=UPI001B861538|nr:uncharacterized protein DEU56DRAFT_812170 [Suillus clintonianus]KAG2132811.1 hypothetical protein DEU56DRAFT_812170 [Suillus clintonianus]